LQGKPEGKEEIINENIRLIPHLSDEKIAGYMLAAKYIICRPGYSTLMDLITLGKKAIFIPTPGQTEQEYLAEKFKKENVFYSESQKDFNLELALKKEKGFSGKIDVQETNILKERIAYILSA
jgi:UDP-N-acetylglucosamine:LPS N-acetylglucosamine transferase